MARPAACHVLVEQAAATRLINTRRREIRVFARCRNERLRLPAFLAHYRQIGADRFFIVDNNSTDETVDYLATQPDVHLFFTANRHSEAGAGTGWINALLAQFGVGFWCVTVDIDELFVFPGSERVSLRALTEHLDRRGHDAVLALMLDLYPAVPLDECRYVSGDNLLAATPFFDPGPFERAPFSLCPGFLILGGVRERVFHPEFRARGVGARIHHALFNRVFLRTPLIRDMPWILARRLPSPPALSKVPLARWDAASRYYKTMHGVSPKAIAPETGVLLHFKFLQDFHAKAVQEAAREEYSEGAAEYKRYAERLNRNPRLTFMDEHSVRFEDTSQLVRLGLMQDSDAWAAARASG